MSLRSEKVSSLVKRVISKPIDDIAREYNAGLVTVTAVRVTDDLHLAKIYVSILGDKISPGKLIAVLEDRKGQLRYYIGKNMKLRYTPDLNFYLDDTLDKIDQIQQLIENVKKNTKQVNVDMDDYDEKNFPKE